MTGPPAACQAGRAVRARHRTHLFRAWAARCAAVGPVHQGPRARHLAVLRRARLLTTERRGRYVHYAVDLPALTALGTDLLAVVLR